MLEFFRKAAQVYFLFFFWLFMIGDVFIGIAAGNFAASVLQSPSDWFSPSPSSNEPNVIVIIITTVILWLTTVFVFSIAGSFLALVDDVAAIRKKLIKGEQKAKPVEKTTPQITARYWDCPRCGSVNSISNLYCQNCGNPKSGNPKSGNSAAIKADSTPRFWTCPDCGCYNQISEAKCNSCGTPKP